MPSRILSALAAGDRVVGPHLVIIAHPDDEAASCAAALCCLEDVVLVQLTSGDANARGTRYVERLDAHRAAHWRVPVVDFDLKQETTLWCLPALLASLRHLVSWVKPAAVWTHPYENGHLDHDSAAWLASKLELPRLEFASYFQQDPRTTVYGLFSGHEENVTAIALPECILERKAAALAAYVSQAHILKKFPPYSERYRVAPDYDFTRRAPAPISRWDHNGYVPSTAQWRTEAAAAC